MRQCTDEIGVICASFVLENKRCIFIKNNLIVTVKTLFIAWLPLMRRSYLCRRIWQCVVAIHSQNTEVKCTLILIGG